MKTAVTILATAPASALFTTTQPWPGVIPPICVYEHLPAFATETDLAAFHESCGGHSITEKWLCTVCNHWHYLAATQPPSGASSGTGRIFRAKAPRYRRERLLLQPVEAEYDDEEEIRKILIDESN